ncbi:uncharacterized protein LOC136028360 [Artemia franciscana]|uniref:Homeobox domain-containing protein n=1 Tax=Artemia franciscana TaxID=6661 RepID=A0AA88HJE6_ARTSF|nr:hypothetical protein QYM36_014301 [Artemia franciscana]
MNYFNVERFFPNNSDGLYLQYNFEEYQQEIQKLCFLQGLSKKGVEVLKRWFYRHRHHPYPTEVEKKQLWRESGLSMLQVEYWFMRAQEYHQRTILLSQQTTTGDSSSNNSYYGSSATNNHQNQTTTHRELPTTSNYVEPQIEASYSLRYPSGYAFNGSYVPHQHLERRISQHEGQYRRRRPIEVEGVFNQPNTTGESSSYSWSPVTESIPNTNRYQFRATNNAQPRINPSFLPGYPSGYPSRGFYVTQGNFGTRFSRPPTPPNEPQNSTLQQYIDRVVENVLLNYPSL